MYRYDPNSCEADSGRDGIPTCEGKYHRYDVSISSMGATVVAVWVGSEPEPRSRVINPTPAELAAMLNHAHMAGMEHEAYNRDCGED